MLTAAIGRDVPRVSVVQAVNSVLESDGFQRIYGLFWDDGRFAWADPIFVAAARETA